MNPIKAALDRRTRLVSTRPAIAQGTATSRTHLGRNLNCNVVDGDWTLDVDMHRNYGGDNTAPNPGVFARAALGSCLAIGYAMWAARLGVELTSIDVTVEADYDVRGELGIDEGIDPGYSAVRYTVSIDSEAPLNDVMNVIDTNDRLSSMRDVFARAIPIERSVEIRTSASRTTETI